MLANMIVCQKIHKIKKKKLCESMENGLNSEFMMNRLLIFDKPSTKRNLFIFQKS